MTHSSFGRAHTCALAALTLAFANACATSSSADPVVITSRPEPAGAHCVAGGSAIDAGRDTNANGALEADEVETTTYVCRPGNGRTGDTIEGSISIWNHDDVAAIAGVTTITGDVILEADGLDALVFPDLVSIGGVLRATGASSIGTLSFPKLVSVHAIRMIAPGADETATDIGEVSFPALSTDVQGEVSIAVTHRVELPELPLAHAVTITIDNAVGTSAELILPKLASVTSLQVDIAGAAALPLALSALAVVDASLDVRTPGSLALPALETIGTDLTISASGSLGMPQLATVLYAARFRSDDALAVSAPMLSAAGELELREGVASIALPMLATINDGLHPEGLRIVNTDLTTAAFPSLNYVVDGIRIGSNPALTSVSLPLVDSILGDDSTGVVVTSNPVLGGFTLPALNTLSGTITVSDQPELTTLAFGALMLPGSNDLTISFNPMLSQCTVTALGQLWAMNGWLGMLQSSGNLACP